MAIVFVPAAVEPTFHVAQNTITGQFFDVVGNVWTAAPPGPGDWDAKFGLAQARQGGTAMVGVTVPDGAGSDWQVLSYYQSPAPVSLQPSVITPNFEIGGGPPAPTVAQDQTPVPADRTSHLEWTDQGLVSEQPRSVSLGVTGLYAIDFSKDSALGNVIKQIDSVIPLNTQGSVGVAVRGRDRLLAKLDLTGQQLGTAYVRAEVTLLGSEHKSLATVAYQVVEPSTN